MVHLIKETFRALRVSCILPAEGQKKLLEKEVPMRHLGPYGLMTTVLQTRSNPDKGQVPGVSLPN